MVDRSFPKHNRHTRDAVSPGAASVYATRLAGILTLPYEWHVQQRV